MSQEADSSWQFEDSGFTVQTHPKSGRWLDKYCWDEMSVNSCNPFSNPESVGYILASSIPTAATVVLGIFLSGALIDLAKDEVGCDTGDDENVSDCKKLLWGLFNPNSVYIVLSLFSSILASIAMPIVGSVIDHSIYRKDIGLYCMVAMTLIVLLEIMISSQTFVAIVVFHMLLLMISLVHAVVYSSYLPQIAYEQLQLVKHRSYSSLSLFGVELSFLVLMSIVLSFIGNNNDVGAARAAAIIAIIMMVPCLYLVYGRLLRCRDAFHVVPGDQIFLAGVYKLWRTIKGISTTNPYLFRYIIAVMLVDGTMSIFSIVATSYLDVQLKMATFGRTMLILSILVVSFLATPLTISLANRLKNHYGDDAYAGKPLLTFTVLYMAISTFIASLALADEGDKNYAYVFGVIWGIGFGFYYSLEKGIYYYMVPSDQSAEFAGIAMFAGKILSWIPLLMFFVLYEAVGTMQYGKFYFLPLVIPIFFYRLTIYSNLLDLILHVNI